MILIIAAVVTLAVVPLSYFVLQHNEQVITRKTIEVCENLSRNISYASTEELLIDSTYDNTLSVISALRQSEITGLREAVVLNYQNESVAVMSGESVHEMLTPEDIASFSNIEKMQMKEISSGRDYLRFVYPITIVHRGDVLRVGSAVFFFDRHEVYSPVREARRAVLFIAVSAFIISIIIAIGSAVIILRPIEDLSEGVKVIAEGNLDHRINVKVRDEIGRLAHSFNNMTSRIQDFTQNLEDKVKQRTAELNESLENVQVLKEQQDGDYYLTSLLVQPLQMNNGNGDRVKTEFITEQKKKFQFKTWDAEIGGDICVTDRIKINGRPYTVVFVADAMGKSMQGAGGALVAGSAFSAYLHQGRTGKSGVRMPELWLRNIYRDIQYIFVSFSGSMSIAGFLGVIDEELGFLYYINAEFPGTILYRDRVATLLEELPNVRKMGTPNEEERLNISVFQMKPGDVILTGSDGREDVQVEDKEGNYVINDNPLFFTKMVEKANGNLDKTLSHLKKKSRLIDDFSLLRISYLENNIGKVGLENKEITEVVEKAGRLLQSGAQDEVMDLLIPWLDKVEKYPLLNKTLGELLYYRGDYEKAKETLFQFFQEFPSDEETLELLVFTAHKSGNLNEAADYAESLLLRRPKHLKIMSELVEVYTKLEVFERARYLIERLKESDSEYQEIEKLEKRLNGEIKKSYQNKKAQAESLFQAGQYKKAANLYRELLTGDEENDELSKRLGTCLFRMGDFPAAVDAYREALHHNPENVKVLDDLAVALVEMQLYKEAEETAEKILALHPGHKSALRILKRIEKEQV